jgi:hypothetical protein
MSTSPFGEFATLLVALQTRPDTAQLLESNEAFDDRRFPTEALRNRVTLLEQFYRCVVALWEEADQRVAQGSKSEQRAAVAEFGASMGLGTKNGLAKQLRILVHFANYLLDSEYAKELAAAMMENRRADIPIEVRRAAVSEVKTRFGIKNWEAARRQLSDARSNVARELGEVAVLNFLPIPGGDLGES